MVVVKYWLQIGNICTLKCPNIVLTLEIYGMKWQYTRKKIDTRLTFKM